MFCGEADSKWNEDALDPHYWKDCDLLAPCPDCAQVVEVAGLPEHLLDDCDQKASFVPCDVTSLAIRENEMAVWEKSRKCSPAPANCIYCPLYLAAAEDTNDAWKEYLIYGCSENKFIQFHQLWKLVVGCWYGFCVV
jgi:centrosomal protein CEP104